MSTQPHAVTLYNKVHDIVDGMLNMRIITLYENNFESDYRPPMTGSNSFINRSVEYNRVINGEERHGFLSMCVDSSRPNYDSIIIEHKCLDRRDPGIRFPIMQEFVQKRIELCFYWWFMEALNFPMHPSHDHRNAVFSEWCKKAEECDTFFERLNTDPSSRKPTHFRQSRSRSSVIRTMLGTEDGAGQLGFGALALLPE
jgi:hypothetical protein